MNDLSLLLAVVIVGVSALLSKKYGRRILISGLTFVGAALFFWFMFKGLNVRSEFRVLVFVWLILGTGLIGVALLLGSLLNFAGINGWLSWRVTILSFIFATILTGLGLFKIHYVDRFIFDRTTPPAVSDFVVARGWPVAFLGDLKEGSDYRWLPGDKILSGRLLSNWLISLYLVLVLSLSIKRYVLAI